MEGTFVPQECAMIEVENLTKYFGPVLALDRISFQVAKGELVGLLGPNGAGKTTTMRILTTYLPATSGAARVAGFDVRNQSMEARQQIGYLPESVPLYPEMRVEEYLDFRGKLKSVDRRQRRTRVEYCLERCRIREVRRRLVGTLSKGYRQRVGLADAMLHDPSLLILDEPTVGLDPIQIRETLALIRELGEKRTILLSTHILSEIEAVCQRIVIISSGRISSDRKMRDVEAANVINVEVSGPAEQIGNALRGIDGVISVHSDRLTGGWFSVDVHVREHKDLREEIAKQLGKNNWPIRQLTQRRRRLEEHFLDVVMRRDPLVNERAAAEARSKTAETSKSTAVTGASR
jgi:ABC-2 type transport system ATP-binding protein